MSVVPRAILDQLGLETTASDLRLQMYDGKQFNADVAEVSVEFLHLRSHGTFVVADSTHGIVARNMLNLMELTLDPPKQRPTA